MKIVNKPKIFISSSKTKILNKYPNKRFLDINSALIFQFLSFFPSFFLFSFFMEIKTFFFKNLTHTFIRFIHNLHFAKTVFNWSFCLKSVFFASGLLLKCYLKPANVYKYTCLQNCKLKSRFFHKGNV